MLEDKRGLLQEFLGLLKGIELGGGKEDPVVKKTGEDAVKVISEFIVLGNSGADPVKAKEVIKLLQKEIATIKKPLFILREALGLQQFFFGAEFFDGNSPLFFAFINCFGDIKGSSIFRT